MGVPSLPRSGSRATVSSKRHRLCCSTSHSSHPSPAMQKHKSGQVLLRGPHLIPHSLSTCRGRAWSQEHQVENTRTPIIKGAILVRIRLKDSTMRGIREETTQCLLVETGCHSGRSELLSPPRALMYWYRGSAQKRHALMTNSSIMLPKSSGFIWDIVERCLSGLPSWLSGRELYNNRDAS